MEAIIASHSLIFFITIILSLTLTPQAQNQQQLQQQQNFIKSSCSSTTYPSLCFSSLAVHAAAIHSDRLLLASTALNLSLSSAKSASSLVSSLAKSSGLRPGDAAAMRDCVEQLGYAVDGIRNSISEMNELKKSKYTSAKFEATMSDVETWVSAALTDEDTCTDGFRNGNNGNNMKVVGNNPNNDVKVVMRGRVVRLAQLTSNALALVNQFASSSHA